MQWVAISAPQNVVAMDALRSYGKISEAVGDSAIKVDPGPRFRSSMPWKSLRWTTRRAIRTAQERQPDDSRHRPRQQGEADAIVPAATPQRLLHRTSNPTLEGVDRPALACLIPGRPTSSLMDASANLSRTFQSQQYAIMAAAFPADSRL
jgi:hypothetical protein